MTIGEIGIYLLEVSILLILLYIFNKLLLAKETLHNLNRVIWLTTLVIAFTLPLCAESSVHYVARELTTQQSQIDDIESAMIFEGSGSGLSATEIIINLLFWIYLSGVALLLVRSCITYTSLLRLVLNRKYHIADNAFREYEQQIGMRQKICYVVHDRNLSPFSWLHFVVISREDLQENGREIVIHELSHIKQHHSTGH